MPPRLLDPPLAAPNRTMAAGDARRDRLDPDARRPIWLAAASISAWLLFSPLALVLAIAAMWAARRVYGADPLAPRLAQARIAATCALALASVSVTAEAIALLAGAPVLWALWL